jgi:pimeloyl-ACP methyl ester carboxylesterase
MPTAESNGIQIEYDVIGDDDAVPMLLVMGFGAQLVLWEDDFCRQLAERGFRVIRYDNRDVGLSTKFDAAGTVDMATAFADAYAGREMTAPYTLTDMADDAVGLLDALGIERAHVVGASMGGMIAQHVALREPLRMLTLTSIMSTTGDRTVGQPRPEAIAPLFAPPPTDREGYIDHTVAIGRLLTCDQVPFDEERARARSALAYDRCFYPEGPSRQLLAVLASGDWTERLATVQVPTLVIHGALDPLVDVSGGEATARAIPGARLMVLDDMGHALAPAHWSAVVDAIAHHASGSSRSA